MPKRVESTAGGQDLLGIVTRRLEAGAGGYYPQSASREWRAVLRGERRRPSARLYHFDLVPERDRRRRVIVKVPDRSGLGRAGPDRPRLFPLGAHPDEAKLEFRALRAIEDAVREADQVGIGWVKALDLLPEVGAIVVEHVDEPTLAHVIRRGSWRLQRPALRHLGPIFENVGVWHAIHRELAAPGESRRATLEELVGHVAGCIEYLGRAGTPPGLLAGLASSFEDRAHRTLPGMLELGAAHTDLSPRNVFVAQDGTVRVFDTLGYWRVPRLEDPAYFLTSLQTAGIQVATRGLAGWWAGTEALGACFLSGAQIRDPSQRDALATYRVVLLLDKWTAIVQRSGPRTRRRSGADQQLAAAVGRCLRPLPST